MNDNNATPAAGTQRQQPALEARLSELDSLCNRAKEIEERLDQLAQRFDPVPSEAPVPEASVDRPSSYSHHMSVIVSRLDTIMSHCGNHLDRIEANA